MIKKKPITLSQPQLACIFLPQEILPLGTEQKLQSPAQCTKYSPIELKICFQNEHMDINHFFCLFNFSHISLYVLPILVCHVFDFLFLHFKFLLLYELY